MKPMTIQTIADIVCGTLLCGDPNTIINGICTDTRKIEQGSLFIPLSGERFDAHDFICDALNLGCAATLTSKKDICCNKPAVYVSNTLAALGKLASAYRKSFNLPLIGITGSVGKTTAKEMTAAVLSASRSVLKTQGNFNNEIGLPLTLFRLEEHHEAAVIEMIMAALPEIAKNVAEPLSKVDKITMYGEGNSTKLISDIVNGTTQVTEGISAGMGIDIKSLIMGALGAKIAVDPQPPVVVIPQQPEEPKE